MNILFQETILMVLILSGVPLVCSAATGFVASALQAVTQIQEQAISYCVKMLTLIVVLYVGAEWGISLIRNFSTRLFESIGLVGV